MTVFADTSGLIAYLQKDDPANPRAIAALRDIASSGSQLVTHSYLVSEAISLVHRRLGWPALDVLLDGLLPLIEIRWVDHDLHEQALGSMRASRSSVSFVDWVSFALMRRERITTAFAFDADFERQGFQLLGWRHSWKGSSATG